MVGDNAAMLHYDGKKWSPIEPLKDEYFTKVKGLGPDQVYVVGENGTVIKYNGKEWSDMSSMIVKHHLENSDNLEKAIMSTLDLQSPFIHFWIQRKRYFCRRCRGHPAAL